MGPPGRKAEATSASFARGIRSMLAAPTPGDRELIRAALDAAHAPATP